MRGALVEHDTIARETIERNGGAIFKTVGDSVCSAFSHPRDALNAAVEVQRSLHAHAWPGEVGKSAFEWRCIRACVTNATAITTDRP